MLRLSIFVCVMCEYSYAVVLYSQLNDYMIFYLIIMRCNPLTKSCPYECNQKKKLPLRLVIASILDTVTVSILDIHHFTRPVQNNFQGSSKPSKSFQQVVMWAHS